jgi:hypothetical protein
VAHAACGRAATEAAHAIGVISHEMRNSAQAVLTSIELLGNRHAQGRA